MTELKNLNDTISKQYAYVKNNVIFNTGNTDNGDSCAVEVTEANAPKIMVGCDDETGAGGTPHYLQSYIEDGDWYTNDGKFRKTIHDGKTVEDEKNIPTYYSELCSKRIQDIIVANYNMTYDDFLVDLPTFGIPLFMFKQSSAGVESSAGVVRGGEGEVVQIDFTEDEYNKLKEDKIRSMALSAANSVANQYGFHVVLASDDCFKISEGVDNVVVNSNQEDDNENGGNNEGG